ncbi:Mitogen-activated protein kinase kinase kinase 3 [Apostasia shenzhenica]|uniref:Mitogen-activated protein kinase kinase kinase 3 n=1 Tax=Apostasia shenzhenica TaxID=1088818 RepID=A0A2I0AU88_9ASPA|nr:Mitogen-activated protein kinase kinase kinase 3 [Apostasia shenzhenica]
MAGAGWLRGPAIGLGSTATVSLAISTASRDVFAVKTAELSRSALLQREQSILTTLDSPAVVSCLGFDVSPDHGGAVLYNLLLEYAPGGSLAQHIKQCGGRLDEPAIRSRTREIAAGLGYLHGRGLVHCDVKPGNVLIGSDGRAKIGDLGCARWVSAGEKEIRGTPMYMAPETARGEEQGTPADIWALGCTVIEMATGLPPWPEVANAWTGIRRIGFSGEAPEIPAWFSDEGKDFLGNCFMVKPEERWTAEQLLHHPFIQSSSSFSNCTVGDWISPKSALDLWLWESAEEDDSGEAAVAGRLRELTAGASGPGPNWTWDEDWVNARSNAGECLASEAAVDGEVLVFADTLIDSAAASTSGGGGGEFVFGNDNVGRNSCERCKTEEGGYEIICFSCKMAFVYCNEDDCSLSFIAVHSCFLPITFQRRTPNLGKSLDPD